MHEKIVAITVCLKTRIILSPCVSWLDGGIYCIDDIKTVYQSYTLLLIRYTSLPAQTAITYQQTVHLGQLYK